MSKLNKDVTGFAILEVLLVIFTLAVIGIAGYFVAKHIDSKKTVSTVPATTSNTKPTSTQKVTTTPATTGTITGQASYPSSSLPADEQICAVSTSDATKVYCINVGANQTINYSLPVPAGSYNVYSTATKELKGKAYYDEYSKCGNAASCPSSGHTAYITVQVTAGATSSDVNPTDWYASSIQNY